VALVRAYCNSFLPSAYKDLVVRVQAISTELSDGVRSRRIQQGGRGSVANCEIATSSISTVMDNHNGERI
jgi:hypothetical protein